jgi:gamma-glutamyl-gamma-aminobutyrate hydrolase PuuD
MKYLVVTTRICNENAHSEIRDSLAHDWYRIFNYFKIIPLLFCNGLNIKLIKEQICNDNCLGVIMTGGNSLSEIDENLPLSKIRDFNEKTLLNLAMENNKPILAVCRGMQLIAHLNGYKLIKTQNHAGTHHQIRARKNIFGILNNQYVNSYHDYAISENKSLEKFDIIAQDENGNIESFMDNNRKIVGIMWHPERDEHFLNYNKKIFKYLFL